MKLCGIIAEFNPLTNGHAHFLKRAKELSGEDLVVIMSGDFVQRGDMAVLNKYERAKLAISFGASTVIELPACFALSSASYFALGGVKILSDIGVDKLAFGVKTEKTNLLIKIAKERAFESKVISSEINTLLKSGVAYSRALREVYAKKFCSDDAEASEIFGEPNNILAIEYLTVIYKLGLNIEPIFIKREDYGYNAPKIKWVKLDGKVQKLSSATFIRKLYGDRKSKKIRKLVPNATFEALERSNIDFISAKERLDAMLISRLRELSREELERYADFNSALSSLVSSSAKQRASRKEIISDLENKCFRKSRINKLLLIPSLDIKKGFDKLIFDDYAVNVLALSCFKRSFMSDLIRNSKCRLVVSNKSARDINQSERIFIDLNQRATNLFNNAAKRAYKEDKTMFV